MSGEREPIGPDATASTVVRDPDREQGTDGPAWSTLGADSVPLHDEAGRAEEREREQRLRLVTGRRRV